MYVYILANGFKTVPRVIFCAIELNNVQACLASSESCTRVPGRLSYVGESRIGCTCESFCWRWRFECTRRTPSLLATIKIADLFLHLLLVMQLRPFVKDHARGKPAYHTMPYPVPRTPEKLISRTPEMVESDWQARQGTLCNLQCNR